MNTVLRRPRHTLRSSSRDLRSLMREERTSVAVLAAIARCSWWRALALRYWSTSWTVDEVVRLVIAYAPASARVPVWGLLARRAVA